jgi:hypothetical protein
VGPLGAIADRPTGQGHADRTGDDGVLVLRA